MATLHIVNRARGLVACLELAAADDIVLLIEDGVYAAIAPQSRDLLVLDDDARARGIRDRIGSENTLISYHEFVDLVAVHTPIVSWN